jgi:uncharacterized membrane protein YdjX (TVP38/TMEM64 family)
MNKNHFIIKICFLIFIFALGAFLFIHFNWYVYFTSRAKTIQLIKSFHPYDALVFIGLQILQVVFAPIPGEATGLIGGFLYGPILGTIYSTIGLTMGSWLAFILARVFGLPFVERVLKPEIVQKYDYVMEHQGVFISFVLFLIPGFPKDYLCYLMGLSRMTTPTFLIISTTGRLFGTILLSLCGHYARQNHFHALLIAIGISCLFILLAVLYRERLLEFLRKKGTTNSVQN